jgi:hypothetical protein
MTRTTVVRLSAGARSQRRAGRRAVGGSVRVSGNQVQ